MSFYSLLGSKENEIINLYYLYLLYLGSHLSSAKYALTISMSKHFLPIYALMYLSIFLLIKISKCIFGNALLAHSFASFRNKLT